MKRFNLLFSFAFLFLLSQGMNAQTVTVSGPLSFSSNSTNDAICGSFPSGEIFGGVGNSLSQGPVVITFSSPVTNVNIPYFGFGASLGGEIHTFNVLGTTSEVVNPNCSALTVSGNTVSNPSGIDQKGIMNISSSTPFTTIQVSLSVPGSIAIPTASYLNSYPNLIGQPDADGDGVADTDDNCPGTPNGTTVDAQGCPDTDGDAAVGAADPDGSDPCNPNPNDAACNNCNAGSTAPQFGN